jgi:hypothetical protein
MYTEFYISGHNRKICFGKQKILLKPTNPRNMIGAGTKAGLILLAIIQICKDYITIVMITQIRNKT